MSHSSPPGNGCSLEDCYTNLFALTDICGIKWKTLTGDPATVEPLEDPVLQTYSKCLVADILCVWRRVTLPVEQPSAPDQYTYGKELWIFWYGAEPENLKQILQKSGLKENDNGAWDKEGSGISYECRTLLFKALHNLIERCLLSKGFVRLGRWFVQPHESAHAPIDRGTHLSFCFNFFLHGESSVCASIEVKQHPAVWHLTNQHLATAQENTSNFNVILVPYGLNGYLTGNTYREGDHSAYKVMEEWHQFYPLEVAEKEAGNDPNKLPPLVEVIVAGVRMKYPSSYVLLCDEEETQPPTQPSQVPLTMPRQSNMLHNGPLTPPTSPLDGATLAGDGGIKVTASHHIGGAQSELNAGLVGKTAEVFSARVTEKIMHDNCVTAGIAKRSMETLPEEVAVGVWNFSDPTVKTTCNCSRHKSRNKSGVSNQDKLKNPALSKVQKGDKPEKVERQQSRLGRSGAPFHRRTGGTEEMLQCDSPVLSGMGVSGNLTNPVSGAALPQLNSTEGGGGAGESPSPADMSPLDEHHTQNQILDPSMPKLSPHPPVEAAADRDSGNSAINKQPSDQQTQSTVATGGSNEFVKPSETSSPKEVESVLSPLESWGHQSEAKTASINSWINSQQSHRDLQGIKRPALPTHNADPDELVITSLYDFNPVKSWIDYPVKRVRFERQTSLDMMNDDSFSNGFQMTESPMYKVSSAPDPYAFPDDGVDDAINPGMVSTRKLRPSHDERQSPHGKMDDSMKDPLKNSNDAFSFKDKPELGLMNSPPRSPNALFSTGLRSEGDLIAKVSDLDHLFQSDDENEDTSMDHIGSLDKLSDDTKITKHTSSMIHPDGTIATADLQRMYPTPPSNNPSDRSPGTSCHDVPLETTLLERPVIKTEVMSSNAEDLFKDLPAVCKLPERADFKGSDKYSPISLQTRLSPVVQPPEYRGIWSQQYHMGHIPDILEKPQSTSHYINIPSIENIPSLPSGMPSSAIESSPATFQNSVGQQRTPMSFDLQSPASNASSYLNKTLNSIDNQGTNNQIPEVDSLVVNIYLMDSRLNLFRDHNFDSCNICVCNMNIKGSDIGIYVPDTSVGSVDSQTRCVCGFSAIMNRKNAHNAGLFYEDEVEITGIRDDRYDRRKPKLVEFHKESEDCDDVPQSVLELLLGQYTVPYPSSSTLQHLTRLSMKNATRYAESPNVFDILQIQDGNEAVYMALDQGRQAMEHCASNKLEDSTLRNTCLHKWQFLQGATRIPLNSQDSVQVLKSLQPLLQDAIQNKRVTRLWDKLSGPLTWKEFHQLAGRGNQENSTPQPVPSLLVGHDRDWLTVSPFALKFWDKQFLEPYGKARDIAYVVLAPDNEYIINAIIVFFKELSTMYQLSHMGRHSPVSKKLRDGIMRVGKKLAESMKNDDQLDPWFKQIGNSSVASKLRLYAQVCRTFLAPHLAQIKVDQTVFEPSTNHRPGYKPTETKPDGSQSDHSSFSMPAPSTPASQFDDRDVSGDDSGYGQKDGSFHEAEQEDRKNTPALMVYLVDPFTYSSDWTPEVERLTKIGLLRCYQQLVKALPEHMQNNVCLQILPLATILESTEKGSNISLLKSISFSIFSTCRWNLTHTVVGKTLTGFGPAAAADLFLRKKEEKGNATKLYSPPFVLAPIKDKQMILKESTREEKQERSIVLFCAYCLSEDQRWLLAVCTDENGELMETCTINVEIPNRNRRKKASARKIGLQKLWDFLLGVVSMATMPCRLVIGRFGRIGHGEMKGWSGLLSKRNIAEAGKRVREMCTQCALTSSGDYPAILSACLVSLESHTSFCVMADAIKSEERMSSNCPLQTPRDTSTTHILVFPTSATATAQANSNMQVQEKAADNDFDTFGLGEFTMDDNEDHNDIMNDIFDSNLEFMAVFQEMTSPSANGGPIGNLSNPSSPTGESGRHHSTTMNGPSVGKNTLSKDPQDEPPNLNQQPLAMGYYLSTARPGPLPKWFWSTCPENEYQCPSCFKAALHIHCSSNHDDYYQLKKNSSSHPLDSTLTPDVLRYVLENYNALSWLTFDTVQNNRQSCLPIHFVVLLQMYHALSAFV